MLLFLQTFSFTICTLISILCFVCRTTSALQDFLAPSLPSDDIHSTPNWESTSSGTNVEWTSNEGIEYQKQQEEPTENYPIHGRSTPEIIQSHGYPMEIHHVVTDDGYVLELHRIPWGYNATLTSNMSRPVVFLQHCLLCSSSDWVINAPDKALGFILADKGFDVWMGNARGNTYSRNHIKYTPSEKEFWNFSWDEIAYYDIPASIDYVLESTNSSSLNYIGFSMGTLVFFGMMSEKPQYNDKVNLMVALGPVAYLGNINGPLSYITRYAHPIKLLAEFFGIYEVLPGGMFLDLLTSVMCDPIVTNIAPICDDLLLRIIGMDTHYTNKKLLPQILAHTPAGTSVKNMVHFMQATNSGRFEKFNYGPVTNRRIYSTPFPASYLLTKTTVPVALYWAENDWFANPKDVEKLALGLPNVVHNRKVPDKTFSHVDFLWSDSSVDLIYMEIIQFLEHYS